jgi:hypothetical protein
LPNLAGFVIIGGSQKSVGLRLAQRACPPKASGLLVEMQVHLLVVGMRMRASSLEIVTAPFRIGRAPSTSPTKPRS